MLILNRQEPVFGQGDVRSWLPFVSGTRLAVHAVRLATGIVRTCKTERVPACSAGLERCIVGGGDGDTPARTSSFHAMTEA